MHRPLCVMSRGYVAHTIVQASFVGDLTDYCTESPAHAKKKVQISDNAPLAGLPGQRA